MLILVQVVEDAAAEYLTYFADKTVSMIRAPDQYTYPAPFNLIELVFIAPFESGFHTCVFSERMIDLLSQVVRLKEGIRHLQPHRHVGPVLHPVGLHRRVRGGQ